MNTSNSLAINALMDQLEERILQTNQLKNASKCLQHHVDLNHFIYNILYFLFLSFTSCFFLCNHFIDNMCFFSHVSRLFEIC